MGGLGIGWIGRGILAGLLLGCGAPLCFGQVGIVGADVSFLRQMESRGVRFKDGGVPTPALKILKNHGYNWVRLRILVDPLRLPNDLAYTVASAKEAHALGMKCLLDFHYSDDWADPAHQKTPLAWAGMPHAALRRAVFEHTRDTLAALRAAGTSPDMVQVGNEVTRGMLWPDGQLPEHWEPFADLLKAGIEGVAAGSGPQARPPIMIHIDKGGDVATTRWFLDRLAAEHVEYEVIGQSYYPWWQGSLQALGDNLRFMTETYHKEVVVVETAYDWRTGEDFAGKEPPFPETPEGQRAFLVALAEVLRAVPGGRVRGLFYWEPTGEGSIAKRALFDDEHNALPAIRAFDRR